MHPITLIPGDGIGPEVASNVVRIIEASGVEIQWETHYAGAQALEKFGETLPKELLDSIVRNKVALKGPITTPVGKGVVIGPLSATLLRTIESSSSFGSVSPNFSSA